MLSKAVENNLSNKKIKTLIDLFMAEKEEVKFLAFLKDFIAFKKENVIIEKDVKRTTFDEFGEEVEYHHASLGNMTEKLNPILAKHNLSFDHTVEQNATAMKVTCHLRHISGHVQSAHMWGPSDTSGAKSPLHAIGSTRTFLKRYTLEIVTGTSTSTHDDDGHMAPRGEITIQGDGPQPTAPKVKIVGKAVGEALRKKAMEAGVDIDLILNWIHTEFKVDKWSQIPASVYDQVTDKIDDMASGSAKPETDEDPFESEEEVSF
jgi:type III secretion system FlhB-like substrate exporter